MEEKLRKQGFLSKIKAGMSKFFARFRREDGTLKTHSRFGALVAFQYRDKVDLSWLKQTKTKIQKTVSFLVKFILLTVIIVVLIPLINDVFKISSQVLNFYLLFLGTYTVLNLITITFGLVKSLYYAEDNKVLATFPVNSTSLFISKLLVYVLFEIKKAFSILFPVSLGFFLAANKIGVLQFGIIFWAILPLLLLIIGSVLVGALLSVPALYIYKVLVNHEWLSGVLFGTILVGSVVGLVLLINKIPVEEGDIDIIRSFPIIQGKINNFIFEFSQYIKPITYVYKSIVGETGAAWIGYRLTSGTVLKFLVVLGADVGLFALAILVIRPFYFYMFTKTFEFNKKVIDSKKKNRVHEKHLAFIFKEIKLTLRNFEISGSYIVVYTAVPVLLLFIDRVFAAMAKSADGLRLVTMFNVLLIILPLLASSTINATLCSREARAGYIKKTKPVRPYTPLLAKMVFNLVLVIPSIIAASFVFYKYAGVRQVDAILLAVAVLFFQYGHIFFSSTLDVMNPQNEVYATEGSSISNPNEIKSTIVAFVTAILATLLVFIFLQESEAKTGVYTTAFIKLAIIGALYFASFILLFFLKVKAFYIDRQEASRE